MSAATRPTLQRMLLYLLFLLSLVHFLELSDSGLHLVADDNTLNDMSIFMAAGKQFVRIGQLYVRSDDMEKDYAPDTPIYKFPPTYQLTIVPFLRMGMSDTQFLFFQHAIYLLLYLTSLGLLILYCYRSNTHDEKKFNAGKSFSFWQVMLPLVIVACWYSPFSEAYLNLLTEIPIIFLLSLSLILMRKYPFLSGGILSVTFLLKIYPGFILVYFIFLRNWKGVSGFLFGMTSLLLITAAYFGTGEMKFYFGKILPLLLQQPIVNHSQNLMIEKLLVSYGLVNTMNGTIHTIARTIALLVLFFIAIFRRENIQQHFALYYGMVVCATLIWLPNYWIQYQMILIIPLFLLITQSFHSSSRIMLGVLILIVIIMSTQEQWSDTLDIYLIGQFKQLQLMDYLTTHGSMQILVHSLTLSSSFMPLLLAARVIHFLCDLKALTPYLLFMLSANVILARQQKG